MVKQTKKFTIRRPSRCNNLRVQRELQAQLRCLNSRFSPTLRPPWPLSSASALQPHPMTLASLCQGPLVPPAHLYFACERWHWIKALLAACRNSKRPTTKSTARTGQQKLDSGKASHGSSLGNRNFFDPNYSYFLTEESTSTFGGRSTRVV